MKLLRRLAVEDKGYEYGERLAIWFTSLPKSIPIPSDCVEFTREYYSSLERGFNDRRRMLDRREKL